MNSIVRLMSNHLKEGFDEKAVTNATVMFLFRGLNYSNYSTLITSIVGYKPKMRELVNDLKCNGYLLKNLKLWLFYETKYPNKAKPSKFNIEDNDVGILAILSPTTKRFLKSLRKYAALTLNKFDTSVTRMFNDTDVWLGKFVSKKLRFVVQMQGLHRSDIETEIVYRGIQGVYAMYPFVDSYLHGVNIMKRCMRHAGLNLIQHYTSQKLQRLLKETDGTFQAKVVSFDSALPLLKDLCTVDPDTGLKQDFIKFADNLPPKKKLFLDLLLGNTNQEFIQFLGKQKATIEKIEYNKYFQLVTEFIQVPIEAVGKFMAQLKQHFWSYYGDLPVST